MSDKTPLTGDQHNKIEPILPLLGAAIDSYFDALQISDLNGQIVYLNREASQRLNINQSEAHKYHVSDFEPLFKDKSIWEDHINDLRAHDHMVIRSQNINQETGSTFPVEVHVSLKTINDEEFEVAFSRDISNVVDAENRAKSEEALQDLLMDISKRFINISVDAIDEGIEIALDKIGTFLNMDRVYIFEYDFSTAVTSNTYEWCADDISPQIDELQGLPLEMVSDWVGAHTKGEPIHIHKVDELPESGLRDILEPQGIKSILSIPLLADDDCIGFIGFDAVKDYHLFSEREQDLLWLFADMLVNIYGRQNTDSEIQKLNRSLSSMSKIALVGGWEYDLKTKQLVWTDMMYTIHGLDSQVDTIDQKDTMSFYKSGEHRSRAEAQMEALLKEGKDIDDEFIIQAKNGYEKWVRVIGKAESHNGEITRIYGSCQDIDDIKKVQINLDQTKSKLTSVFNELQDVIWSINLSDFSVRFLTPSATDLYKLPFDTLKENYLPWKTRVHPDDVMETDEILDKLRSQNNQMECEMRLTLSDEELKWIRVKAQIIKDNSGKEFRLDGSIVDITNLKRIQSESEKARIEAEEANLAKS